MFEERVERFVLVEEVLLLLLVLTLFVSSDVFYNLTHLALL